MPGQEAANAQDLLDMWHAHVPQIFGNIEVGSQPKARGKNAFWSRVWPKSVSCQGSETPGILFVAEHLFLTVYILAAW